ncbi:MAG: hypothetical protein J6T74_01140 [Clostridia bacterium]|nr:hypothetical protein [Clostridia bacterium]
MTNEIKEILDIFKQVDLETDVGGCSNCPRRKDKNRTCVGCLNNAKDKLLDYITNLQEENERLTDLYRRTIDHLFKIGNDELARYFQAQINDCPSFVPQDLRGDE